MSRSEFSVGCSVYRFLMYFTGGEGKLCLTTAMGDFIFRGIYCTLYGTVHMNYVELMLRNR